MFFLNPARNVPKRGLGFQNQGPTYELAAMIFLHDAAAVLFLTFVACLRQAGVKFQVSSFRWSCIRPHSRSMFQLRGRSWLHRRRRFQASQELVCCVPPTRHPASHRPHPTLRSTSLRLYGVIEMSCLRHGKQKAEVFPGTWNYLVPGSRFQVSSF